MNVKNSCPTDRARPSTAYLPYITYILKYQPKTVMISEHLD
jgi:hypothetical protein